jgi:glucose/arabinose dehydrogenase
VAALAVAATLLTACGADGRADDPVNEPSADTATASPETAAAPGAVVEATAVASGLDSPWGLAPLDDGSLLVGSRNTGVVSLVRPDGSTTEVGSLDVRAEGEGGLLGLAVTDDESTLYAYYTAEATSRVVTMPWDGTTLGEPTVVVDDIPGGETFHQGGAVAIGPDDLLYVATGDNGDPASAQDLASLSGKVLRYTLDGTPAPGNPGGTAVYTHGHRNVEGLTFDEQGRLWASEFGQDTWDELNLIEAGADYGWPEVEGSGGGEEYVDPVAVWRTADASPSGITAWQGSLWMAALRGQTLWEIPLAAGSAGSAGSGGTSVGDPVPHLAGEHGRLRNVTVEPGGQALLLATSNTDGRGEPDAEDDRLLRVSR